MKSTYVLNRNGVTKYVLINQKSFDLYHVQFWQDMGNGLVRMVDIERMNRSDYFDFKKDLKQCVGVDSNELFTT